MSVSGWFFPGACVFWDVSACGEILLKETAGPHDVATATSLRLAPGGTGKDENQRFKPLRLGFHTDIDDRSRP